MMPRIAAERITCGNHRDPLPALYKSLQSDKLSATLAFGRFMGSPRQRFPIFLPLAIFLFDVLATVLVLSRDAHAAALSRYSSLILLPGSYFYQAARLLPSMLE